MPIHDWSEIDANLFHDFHQAWAMQMRNALNAGLLPEGFSALVEQHAAGLVPDVLALERRSRKGKPMLSRSVLTREEPATRFAFQHREQTLAAMANRVSIQHGLGEVVCIIEIVSPGNKSSVNPFRKFVEKTHEFLEAGVNVLIVDLFPPTPRDPRGIHKAIWDHFDEDEPFDPPSDKPLTLAAYVAGDEVTGSATRAYVEPVAVGDNLPDMPAYLDGRHYVPIPLEATYREAWATSPADLRFLVENGHLPGE